MDEQQEPTEYRHQVLAQLRFSDIDRLGHVNNNVYFSLYDMAKEKYLDDIVDRNALSTFAIVVVNVNATFLAPMFHGDEIAIESAITHIGNKSFTICQRAVNLTTGEVKCKCRSVMVCLDIEKNESTPLPESFRKKVTAFEGLNLK